MGGEGLYDKVKSLLMKDELEEAVSISTSADIPKLDLALVRYLVQDRGMSGILVCLDRPPSYYKRLFQTSGIDPGSVRYIDATSERMKEADEATLVSEHDLTSLKISISQYADRCRKAAKGKGCFLLFDCIATLSLYNEQSSLGQFLHDVALRLRELGVYTVMLLEEGEIGLGRMVKPFCDSNFQIGVSIERAFANALSEG